MPISLALFNTISWHYLCKHLYTSYTYTIRMKRKKVFEKIINEYDKFNGMLWKQGDSVVITIPNNVVRFTGFEPGQEVIVMIKKKEAQKNAIENKEEQEKK